MSEDHRVFDALYDQYIRGELDVEKILAEFKLEINRASLVGLSMPELNTEFNRIVRGPQKDKPS